MTRRSPGTRTSRITQTSPTGLGPIGFGYGTQSDFDGNNFEDPKDIADIASIDTDIGGGRQTPPRRPPMGGIDLGKGLDIEKPKPPRSPIGIEIGKSPSGNLGIGVSVPIGLSPFGARGGVSIDPATGQIRGGYGGLGIGKGPIGTSIDVGVDGGGCFRYITVSFGPFAHTYGQNVCEPKAPRESPAPELPPDEENGIQLEDGEEEVYCVLRWSYFRIDRQYDVFGNLRSTNTSFSRHNTQISDISENVARPGGIPFALTDSFFATNTQIAASGKELSPGVVSRSATVTAINGKIAKNSTMTAQFSPRIFYTTSYGHQFQTTYTTNSETSGANGLSGGSTQIPRVIFGSKTNCNVYVRQSNVKSETFSTSVNNKCIIIKVIPLGNQKQPIANLPPIPNPPPKKMNDKCCKQLALLMLMQHQHLGVQPIAGLNLQDWGVQQKGSTFAGEPMAFPFEVPAMWADPTSDERARIKVSNVSELLLIIGIQNERLERFTGTKEFLKDSNLRLKSSQEGTITWLKNKITGGSSGDDFKYPDPNDYWFNTDDGIINEKTLEVKSLADATRYLVESQNRLERILPIAELKNSSIPSRWVYPGTTGQLNVGNLIHLIEYMFRADDRARGYLPIKIKVKDANPAVKGDQPVYLEFQSQADLLREMFKFIIEVEGDGDQSNNFLLRLAMQSCQNHQLNVQNNAMLDAIVEYLDFKVNRVTTKVPMPFSPFAGKEPSLLDKLLDKLGFKYQPIPGKIDKNTEEEVESLFEGILQNTEVKVPIVEIPPGEKKYLSEALMEILKHASAASAAVSEKVGDGALKRMIESAGIAQMVSRFLLKKDIAEANGVGDLDQWINSAELGYTDKPESQSLKFPETNPLEPYDRPISENPLIREIDTKDPKAD